MANDHSSLATVLLRDLDAGAKPAAALRAINALPEALRSQAARASLFTGCVLFATDRAAGDRGRTGLSRAHASMTVIRDFYAHRRVGPGRHLHGDLDPILTLALDDRGGLIASVDRFLHVVEDILADADRAGAADQSRFGDIVDLSFSDLLPEVSKLLERTEHAVAAVRARREAAADRAHSDTRDALKRIERLTRIVRMISVNARVEAARAGDAGRSFNVIASEITDLAGQVEVASKEISDRIGDIVTSFRAT